MIQTSQSSMARIDQVHMGVNPFSLFFLRANIKLTSAPEPLFPYNMNVLFPVRIERTPAEGAVALSRLAVGVGKVKALIHAF